MIKLLWIDCETTGLDPTIHDIIQLSGIFEIPKKFKVKFNYTIQPDNWDSIDDKALEVNGISCKQLRTFESSKTVYDKILTMIFNWFPAYNPLERLILGGHNVAFDSAFIDEFFKRNDNNYWKSYVTSGTLDLMTLSVAYEVFLKQRVFESYSLSSICSVFGVKLLNAHDSLSDIIATRECCLKIWTTITGESTW